MKGWVPYVRFDIGTHVLIEPTTRSTFVTADFKGLANAHIVAETSFVFALHIVEYREVFSIEVITVLMMLGNA